MNLISSQIFQLESFNPICETFCNAMQGWGISPENLSVYIPWLLQMGCLLAGSQRAPSIEECRLSPSGSPNLCRLHPLGKMTLKSALGLGALIWEYQASARALPQVPPLSPISHPTPVPALPQSQIADLPPERSQVTDVPPDATLKKKKFGTLRKIFGLND